MHRDNLGSIDAITDRVGNVVERMSFDPFGARRDYTWRSDDRPFSLIPVLTNRGFTGHETLDSVGLIHMNGRVYDTALGRFLSADPFIQAPLNTQSFNRYSYVMNSPLVYTDPSGYNWGATAGQSYGGSSGSTGRSSSGSGSNSRGGDGNNNRGVRYGETVTVTARAPDHRGDVYGGESRSDVGVKTGRDPDVPPDNIVVAPVRVITGTPIPDYEGFFGLDRNWFTDYLYNSYRHAAAADLEYTIWKVLQSVPDGGPAISVSVKMASVLAVAKVPVVKRLYPYDLIPTQPLTKNRKQMKRLREEIEEAGEIKESLKYVEHNGQKYLVDGHHRLSIAKEKGIKDVLAERVDLPYKGYKTVKDLEYSQY